MLRGENRTVGMIVIGCCLLLACSGCYHTRPRHGVILRGDWSFEINRTPWIKQKSIAQQERSDLGTDCGPAFPVAPDRQAPVPADHAPDETGVEVEPSSYQSACQPNDCPAHPAPIRGLLWNLCGIFHHPLGPPLEAEEVYQNHPRFHPVPTQPTFSPRLTPMPAIEAGPVAKERSAPPVAPDPEAPRIEVIPPPRESEEIRVPEPEKEKKDRMASPPRRLETASRSDGWILRRERRAKIR